MIAVTDEMKAAFRTAQEQRAAELVAEGAPIGAHDILDRGLAAVLAIVERDWNMQPNPNARPPRLVVGVAYCGACAQVEGDPHAKWCERIDGQGRRTTGSSAPNTQEKATE